MRTPLPDPASAPELFENILTRRVIAFFVDLAILFAIVSFVVVTGIIMGFMTMGAAWLALLAAVPLAIVGYYAATLGSPRRATIGMRMMDIVLTPTRGLPLDGGKAFLHPLVFWLTVWILPPVSLLIALFTPRRQLLHDLVVGTLMLRRSPMEKHWARYQG